MGQDSDAPGNCTEDRATTSVTPRYEETRGLDVWNEDPASYDGPGYEARLTYEEVDGWTETYLVAEVEGALVVTGVEVRPTAETPLQGLTSRRMHGLRAGRAVRDAERGAREIEGRYVGVPVSPTPSQARKTGTTADRAAVLERVDALDEAAKARGERHPAKWVHAQLQREGIYRSRETVRNDISAVRRARRERRAQITSDELPAIEAGNRGLDRLRWELKPGES